MFRGRVTDHISSGAAVNGDVDNKVSMTADRYWRWFSISFFFTLLTEILKFGLLVLMNSFVVVGLGESSLHIVACVVTSSVPVKANIGIPSDPSKQI